VVLFSQNRICVRIRYEGSRSESARRTAPVMWIHRSRSSQLHGSLEARSTGGSRSAWNGSAAFAAKTDVSGGSKLLIFVRQRASNHDLSLPCVIRRAVGHRRNRLSPLLTWPPLSPTRRRASHVFPLAPRSKVPLISAPMPVTVGCGDRHHGAGEVGHQAPDRVRGVGGRPAPIMSRTGSSRPAAESTMNTIWWMWSLPGGSSATRCTSQNRG
jgi:hypothetical protein